ncbi:MAG: alkaline phosphatase D family protein [Bacteroidales bacterium]
MKITLPGMAISLAFLLGSCISQPKNDGPYFGNGFHNGWADHQSIVLWTRLTKNPGGNVDGKKFLVPTSEELEVLLQNNNEADIFNSQIPEGFQLEDMEGACPGATGEIRLTYHPSDRKKDSVVFDWQEVDETKNYTLQWRLSGLRPGTRYMVKMEARANTHSVVSDQIEGVFKTPPEADMAEDVDFCIVTCHDFWRRDSTAGHKIYKAMSEMSPDFYVHTGDIEYYDKPEPYAMTEELMRYKWDRLFALPLQRNFWTRVTCYFMKDDHDALTDDAWPGMSYGTVSWKRGLEIFDGEQFPSHETHYKTVRWGKDLQIWITEGRNYRSANTDSDGPGKSIWGKEQKQWVFKTLAESDATFKILITPDPIIGPDRDNKKDNYSNSNWKFEGDEIREFINQYDNVFICNGDRHWQYVSHPEDSNLWEFSCGAGSDSHAEGWNQEDVRPEHRFLRVKGGFLRGTVSQENDHKVLTFRHYNVEGQVVHTEEFRR